MQHQMSLRKPRFKYKGITESRNWVKLFLREGLQDGSIQIISPCNIARIESVILSSGWRHGWYLFNRPVTSSPDRPNGFYCDGIWYELDANFYMAWDVPRYPSGVEMRSIRSLSPEYLSKKAVYTLEYWDHQKQMREIRLSVRKTVNRVKSKFMHRKINLGDLS